MSEQDNNLVPQDRGSEDLEDWVIPTGAREEFGFPARSTLQQRQCWENQERFLAAFRQCCRISEASKAVGLTAWAVEKWQRTDKYGFLKRMAMAEQEYVEKLEAEVDRRGIEGIDKPIYYKGERVDTIREYSDNLAMFRLKKLRPQYKDSYSAPPNERPPITKIIIHMPPGVELPAPREAAEAVIPTEYVHRELPPAAEGEYREVEEGDQEGQGMG